MKLPRNEIGVTDLLSYGLCPARMKFGMRRHTGKESPEGIIPEGAYGSAVHHMIEVYDQSLDEETAIAEAFKKYMHWLDPEDLDALRQDLETYKARDPIGVRTVLSEEEARVPLFEHPTEGQIFFRFRVDRLYQRLDNEGIFEHIDYKTSKWRRSEAQVHEDPQMWSYNWGIHELLPEVEHLRQFYDQLRFGVEETSKTDHQRAQIKEWLIVAATAVIEDEQHLPTFNDFCPWCSLKMDCPEISEGLTDYALARIAALAPRNPIIKKDGTPGKRLGPPELDPKRYGEYVEELPKVKQAIKVLEKFAEVVSDGLKQMPSDRRESFGYRTFNKNKSYIPPHRMRDLVDEIGWDDYSRIASVSYAAAERHFGKGAEELTVIDRYLETVTGAVELLEVKS
jgi:hypothetical protein